MARDEFMKKLSDYNIGYGLHFPPAHRLSYVKKSYNVPRGELSQTEQAGERIVSLPLFPDMTEADVDYVCCAIGEILSNV
jgi:UDP-4-amino-4-deoxy-L-arabinose-oxoglutarate aminotransferase